MAAGLSNGSAFAGLNTNTLFYNFTLALATLSELLAVLAVAGTSHSGPSVWTGRALQAENKGLEKIGLAHLYPAY